MQTVSLNQNAAGSPKSARRERRQFVKDGTLLSVNTNRVLNQNIPFCDSLSFSSSYHFMRLCSSIARIPAMDRVAATDHTVTATGSPT